MMVVALRFQPPQIHQRPYMLHAVATLAIQRQQRVVYGSVLHAALWIHTGMICYYSVGAFDT
ncbi:MAG: hypothetical protein WBC85_07790 [Planktotalea sp.]|uniref:hypothetical protein n=1 Tax=Planktotalea sp. TaxID=2029877 RepID=UPI003C70F215